MQLLRAVLEGLIWIPFGPVDTYLCCFPSAVLFQHLIIYRGLCGRLYRGSYCLIELLDSRAAKIIKNETFADFCLVIGETQPACCLHGGREKNGDCIDCVRCGCLRAGLAEGLLWHQPLESLKGSLVVTEQATGF